MLSQYISTSKYALSPRGLRTSLSWTLNPNPATTAVLTLNWFGLLPFRSPLLGESLRFLLLGVLRCFTSPGSSLMKRVSGFGRTGCPIRRSPGQGPLASRRSFSQLAASFVGCRRQGIHRVPFLPFPHIFACSSLYSAVKVRRVDCPLKTSGGDDRIRTDDFLRARQALSH